MNRPNGRVVGCHIVVFCVTFFTAWVSTGSAHAGGGLPPGWYKGQTHTHSEHSSDGTHPIEQIAEWYQERDYDFVVLSDHGKMTPFSHLSAPGFLAIDGEELSCCRNHTNGIGHRHGVPGVASTIRENIARIVDLGGIAHLNHPSGLFGLQFGDLVQVGPTLEMMEIWNGIWRQGGRDIVLWDRLLSSGRLVYGVASDDMHQLHNHGDKAWIVVRADELSEDAILAAMVAGDMYASTGIVLEDYRVEGGRMIVESRNGDFVRFIGREGVVLHEVNGPAGAYTFQGHEGYVRAEVVQAEIVSDRVRGEEKRAWMQPVIIGSYRQDVYATELVASSFPQGEHRAYEALGRPHEGPLPADPEEHHATRLEPGQWIELDMGIDSPLVDREGPDLFVEELDLEDGFDADDRYLVSVRLDPEGEWLELGEGLGDTEFDLAGVLPQVRFVRIESHSEDEVEIDGLVANGIDPFADRVSDHAGVVGGHHRYAVGPPSVGRFEKRHRVEYAAELAAGEGVLTLDLGAGEEAVDDLGDDLFVAEAGAEGSYRVSASRDGVHWTEIADATGSAAFDLAGRLPWVRYVRIEAIDGRPLVDGVWVQHLGADSPVEVRLELSTDTIPAEGGVLEYTMFLENRSDEIATLSLWADALAPDGATAGPFFGPREVTMQPGQSRERTLSIEVPAEAPAGRHLMIASWGSSPAPVVDVDVRAFTKQR